MKKKGEYNAVILSVGSHYKIINVIIFGNIQCDTK